MDRYQYGLQRIVCHAAHLFWVVSARLLAQNADEQNAIAVFQFDSGIFQIMRKYNRSFKMAIGDFGRITGPALINMDIAPDPCNKHNISLDPDLYILETHSGQIKLQNPAAINAIYIGLRLPREFPVQKRIREEKNRSPF
jgi:hypothetical protein